MHLRARAVLLCLLVPAAAAVGQLVTQPPEHAPRPEDRIAINRTGGRPGEHPPAAPVPAFRSLRQRDADGHVIPLREPIEWAALRNNPLVTPDELARIEPELAARRRIFDRIVIENLDLAEQIDEGLFETIDLTNNKAFTKLLDVSKPLRPEDMVPMSRALLKKGLLSKDQEGLNNKIAQEYRQAIMPEAPPDANPAQKGALARRSLALWYKQGLDEPLFELRRLRLAAARSLPKSIPSLNLDAAAALAVTKLAEGIRPGIDEKTTIDQMNQINARLTLEQRKQLLRAAIERP